MKKLILLLSLLAVIGVSIKIEQVEAKQCTATYAAPHMYQVSPRRRSSTYILQTAASACKGSNTEVWFSSFKSLPDNYAYDYANVWVDLYDVC